MSSFQRVLCTGLGAECVPIREVFSFQLCTGLELGHEDMSLLERCPHFRGCLYGLGT